MAEAYTIMMAERCTQCGYPRYVCHSDDPDIQIRLGTDHCSVKEKIDRKNADNSKKKNYKEPHGTVWKPEAYSVSGADLVTYREPYYKAEDVKRKAVLDSRRHEV